MRRCWPPPARLTPLRRRLGRASWALGAALAGTMASKPDALTTLDLKGVAEYIKSGQCKSVVVLTGAGVSTGAGIPDFRSPGGMYATLRPELLTATKAQKDAMAKDPQAVVDKEMFFANQFPYMEVRRPFILGTQEQKWRPTLGHWFMKFLEEEKLLTRLFTQNIDGLDYHTGISHDLVCNVHGSIGKVSCESCGYKMPFDEFCNEVKLKIKDIYGVDTEAPLTSTEIPCSKCNKPTVKPMTVLFGSSLPKEFFDLAPDDSAGADLLIVAGTSLRVSPANSMVRMVPSSCPRLIVNNEQVGQDLGIVYGKGSTRDVFAGERGCDEVFLELMKLLGWEDKVRKICDRLPEGNQDMVKDL